MIEKFELSHRSSKKEIPHQALLLTPKKYNQVIASGYNAVSVKVALHNQAIYLLLQQGAKAQKIVVDAFTTKKNYDRYVQAEANQVPQVVTLEEKAEGKYLSVAVSSIIARDLFLQNLEDLSQELGYTLPSGLVRLRQGSCSTIKGLWHSSP